MEELIAVGKIVHYVLPTGRNTGEHRPAIVVRIWGTPMANTLPPAVQLQVFTDGTNDFAHDQSGANGLLWAASVPHSEEPRPGTWHWIERA